jgi:cation diffusion facilitator CzcD-associated flavoprotein CzcO
MKPLIDAIGEGRIDFIVLQGNRCLGGPPGWGLYRVLTLVLDLFPTSFSQRTFSNCGSFEQTNRFRLFRRVPDIWVRII